MEFHWWERVAGWLLFSESPKAHAVRAAACLIAGVVGVVLAVALIDYLVDTFFSSQQTERKQ